MLIGDPAFIQGMGFGVTLLALVCFAVLWAMRKPSKDTDDDRELYYRTHRPYVERYDERRHWDR